MLGVQKTTELATALFHIGGLSGAAVMLAERHTGDALILALVATACVLILTGGIILAEFSRVKVRQYVRKHESRTNSEPRDKEGPNA
jgi:hypothetical protein